MGAEILLDVGGDDGILGMVVAQGIVEPDLPIDVLAADIGTAGHGGDLGIDVGGAGFAVVLAIGRIDSDEAVAAFDGVLDGLVEVIDRSSTLSWRKNLKSWDGAAGWTRCRPW